MSKNTGIHSFSSPSQTYMCTTSVFFILLTQYSPPVHFFVKIFFKMNKRKLLLKNHHFFDWKRNYAIYLYILKLYCTLCTQFKWWSFEGVGKVCNGYEVFSSLDRLLFAQLWQTPFKGAIFRLAKLFKINCHDHFTFLRQIRISPTVSYLVYIKMQLL